MSVPPRGSVPPEIPNYDSMPPDTSGTDIENALAPVRETEEEYLETDLDAEHHTRSSFSIGTLLGKGVHWGFTTCWRIIATIVSLFASITGAIARAARFVVNILLAPLRLLFRIDSAAVSQIGKYALVALGLYLSWAVLQSGLFTIERTPVRSYPSPYLPPDVPPVDISELSERLLRLESALGALSMASERSRTYIEGDAKHQAELAGRIGALESHVQKDGSKAKDLETKLKTSTKQGLDAVKQEMQTLRAQIQAQQEREVRHTGSHSDEEARAKLRALEERVGTVEGGVKEALELGKSSGAVGAGGAAVVSGSMAAWWNKLASGKSTGMTIKSSDGQDVTGLIRHLVDSAVLTSSKDMLARPDYAMYSGGASVIPSLTSDTFEVVPDTFVGKMIGTITGLGQAIGRPPVTALNHELHTGYCWPFAGMKGQLGVMLAVPTVISDVTIDHAPVEVALDLRSAPRHMQLWGLLEGKDNIEKYMEWQKQRQARREEARAQAQAAGQPLVDLTHDDDEERYPYPDTLPKSPPYVPLADFVYNIHAPNYIQTFPIREEIKELGLDFGVVVLMVDNNWGKEEFTCLYRMRIHGERLGGIPEPLGEEWASGAKALEVAPFFGNHESMTVEDSV